MFDVQSVHCSGHVEFHMSVLVSGFGVQEFRGLVQVRHSIKDLNPSTQDVEFRLGGKPINIG